MSSLLTTTAAETGLESATEAGCLVICHAFVMRQKAAAASQSAGSGWKQQ